MSGGGTEYKKDSKRVEISFYSGLDGTIVHETRHGAGYSWGEWGWNNVKGLPKNYDYQDEFEAYQQESNYTRIITGVRGRSKIEIINVIESNYGTKDYIIKEFQQYCEPEK